MPHISDQFHFKDALTLANLIGELKDAFPELSEAFLEYTNDLPQTGEYDQGFFTYIFIPFLRDFLHGHHKHPSILGKRLFYFLEKMGRSPDWPVTNILAVVILEHLSPSQNET